MSAFRYLTRKVAEAEVERTRIEAEIKEAYERADAARSRVWKAKDALNDHIERRLAKAKEAVSP